MANKLLNLNPNSVVAESSDIATLQTAIDGKQDYSGAAEAAQLRVWYPDGDVTSPSQWTSGLAYDYDDTAHTASVQAFSVGNSTVSGAVVIPPYIERNGLKYTVTSIGAGTDPATGNSVLTSVVAPTTVTSIGNSSFNNCTALTLASFPAATTIFGLAFKGCTALIKASVPLVKDLYGRAFTGCTSLTSADYPLASNSSLNQTGLVYLFNDCSSLKTISFPNIERLGASSSAYTFAGCTSLKSAYLPKLIAVGGRAFSGCTSLEVVDFGPDTRTTIPGLTNAKTSFANVPSTCKIIIPDANWNSWITATNWSTLYDNHSLVFMKHSEWAYARKYEAGGTQVNADWNATSGVAQILNKPTNLQTTDNLVTSISSSSTNTQYPSALSVYNAIQAGGGGGGGGGGGSGHTVWLITHCMGYYDNLREYTVNGESITSAVYSESSIQRDLTMILTNVETIKIARNHSDNTIRVNGVDASFGVDITITGPTLIVVSRDECLSPDTAIIMADGSSKRLDTVREGDTVLTPLGPDRVSVVSSGTGKATDIWTFSDGTVIKTIGRHRFFDCDLGEMLYLEAWNLGEHALRTDFAKVELVSHERIEGEAPHATLFTEKWNMYYANGLLAGNRKSRGLDKIAWSKNP